MGRNFDLRTMLDDKAGLRNGDDYSNDANSISGTKNIRRNAIINDGVVNFTVCATVVVCRQRTFCTIISSARTA